MAAPPRSSGTARTVRSPERAWRDRLSGKSVSSTASTSWMWTGRRSDIARPLDDPRSSGRLSAGVGGRSEMRRELLDAALDETDRAVVGPAHARRILGHRIEHRLKRGLRPADDAENLGGRPLLLERLGQLAVPGLEILRQAGVLDGDGGLLGKALEERDLLGGERHGPGSGG